MKLKTVISAVSFFATLPCALLGLVGGEVVAQTLESDFGLGQATVNLVLCYKGKSMFATSINICVESGGKAYCFSPQIKSGWRPQISCISMRDGQECLLVTVGDETVNATHFLLYQLAQGEATLVEHYKIFG